MSTHRVTESVGDVAAVRNHASDYNSVTKESRPVVKGHECIGGCGKRMPYPEDRCEECRQYLASHRGEWSDASSNINPLSIMQEAHRDPKLGRVPIRSRQSRKSMATGGRPPAAPSSGSQPIQRWNRADPSKCPTCGRPRQRGYRYCSEHRVDN